MDEEIYKHTKDKTIYRMLRPELFPAPWEGLVYGDIYRDRGTYFIHDWDEYCIGDLDAMKGLYEKLGEKIREVEGNL